VVTVPGRLTFLLLHIIISGETSDISKGGHMRKSFLSFIVALVVLLVGSLYSAGKGESLTVSKCGTCHKTGKFCSHLGTKDTAAWAKVIDRMVKKGAKVDNDEKKIIADYLSKLAKGSKPVCN